jgi:AbrB family looped-hinge helix DNA binding protein
LVVVPPVVKEVIMALRRSKITRKGQVTIPIEFRKELELREGDTVLFEMSERGLHIVRPEDVVVPTAGMFREYANTAPDPTREEIWIGIAKERGNIE